MGTGRDGDRSTPPDLRLTLDGNWSLHFGPILLAVMMNAGKVCAGLRRFLSSPWGLAPKPPHLEKVLPTVSERSQAGRMISSLLRELDAVALATNVMVFLGQDTRRELPLLRPVCEYSEMWVSLRESSRKSLGRSASRSRRP